MRKAMTIVAASTIALLASGCDWTQAAYGLAALNGVVVLDARDRDYHDHDGCGEWYDFADPGCY